MRSTSMVKSTWPGVSMRWMSKPRQAKLVAAAVMVMPRSRSCGIQSIWASPSWTSPILWMRPEWKRNRSLTVVLPASMWATMPMLRTRVILGGAAIFGEGGVYGTRRRRRRGSGWGWGAVQGRRRTGRDGAQRMAVSDGISAPDCGPPHPHPLPQRTGGEGHSTPGEGLFYAMRGTLVVSGAAT